MAPHQWLLELQEHHPQLNLSSCAELGAIPEIMLTCPQGLQHHIQRRLNSEDTHLLWSQQASITAHKVRAHIGCLGNEHADRLCEQGHTSSATMSYTLAPQPCRGAHGVVHFGCTILRVVLSRLTSSYKILTNFPPSFHNSLSSALQLSALFFTIRIHLSHTSPPCNRFRAP